MRFDVLTLFPEIFSGYLTQSLLKLAIDRGLVDIRLWNIRDWAEGKHQSVDDRPYGGGPGMVLMPGPVYDAVEAIRPQHDEPGELILLTPTGERFRKANANRNRNELRIVAQHPSEHDPLDMGFRPIGYIAKLSKENRAVRGGVVLDLHQSIRGE